MFKLLGNIVENNIVKLVLNSIIKLEKKLSNLKPHTKAYKLATDKENFENIETAFYKYAIWYQAKTGRKGKIDYASKKPNWNLDDLKNLIPKKDKN